MSDLVIDIKNGDRTPQPKFEVKVVYLVSGDTLLCELREVGNKTEIKRPLAIELMPVQQNQMVPVPTPWGGLLTLGLGAKPENFTINTNHVIITRDATVDEVKLWQQSTSSIALV